MYFPYLRGRQYELLALSDLVNNSLLSDKVIPIIEPVKLSSTFINTMKAFVNNGKRICIIYNPLVGNFLEELQDTNNQNLINSYNNIINNADNIILMNIMGEKYNSSEFIHTFKNRIGTICTNKDAIGFYEDNYLKFNIKTMYNLIPDESVYRRRIKDNRVLLADRFVKLQRNNDYSKNEDEPFSDDHLYYLEDGYKGFSDYSIIGEEYNETGFAPYAIAIHIVYFDKNNSLRIRHFVSDTNDDISDPATKFKESLTKLIEWNKTEKISTFAMSEFERLYKNEAYPGLGIIKKLSIMHHLELIGEYLNRLANDNM